MLGRKSMPSSHSVLQMKLGRVFICLKFICVEDQHLRKNSEDAAEKYHDKGLAVIRSVQKRELRKR